jgi:hypothetical protein
MLTIAGGRRSNTEWTGIRLLTISNPTFFHLTYSGILLLYMSERKWSTRNLRQVIGRPLLDLQRPFTVLPSEQEIYVLFKYY